MSDKMPDAWIVPSASGDGYLCTLSYVNLPGWNRYVPAARIAELERQLAAERERREAAENLLLSYESQDFRAIAKHFARYEKLCASSSRALAD